MKIGTLLTAAIVSLSAVGGGLAVYVAVSKYQTMDKVSVAQSRLEIVRAVGEIPRYMNPERGFATNIMFGPPAVDPKLIAELDNYRKNTDGARDKMNRVKTTLQGAIDDSAAVGSSIDALNTQFAALRAAIDKALTIWLDPIVPDVAHPRLAAGIDGIRRAITNVPIQVGVACRVDGEVAGGELDVGGGRLWGNGRREVNHQRDPWRRGRCACGSRTHRQAENRHQLRQRCPCQARSRDGQAERHLGGYRGRAGTTARFADHTGAVRCCGQGFGGGNR